MNPRPGRRPRHVLRALRARALPAIIVLGCFLAGGGVALATGGFQERQGGYPCGTGSYPGGCSTGTYPTIPCGTGSYPVGCPTQTGTTSTSTTQTQTQTQTATTTQTQTTTKPPTLPPAAVQLAKFALGSSTLKMSPKGIVVLGKV